MLSVLLGAAATIEIQQTRTSTALRMGVNYTFTHYAEGTAHKNRMQFNS